MQKKKYDSQGVPTPLTADDILMGLECCTKEDGCTNCPFLGLSTAECANRLNQESAKLVKKLMAKNKRLEKENYRLKNASVNKEVSE